MIGRSKAETAELLRAAARDIMDHAEDITAWLPSQIECRVIISLMTNSETVEFPQIHVEQRFYSRSAIQTMREICERRRSEQDIEHG